jgi:hypothetical protein
MKPDGLEPVRFFYWCEIGVSRWAFEVFSPDLGLRQVLQKTLVRYIRRLHHQRLNDKHQRQHVLYFADECVRPFEWRLLLMALPLCL